MIVDQKSLEPRAIAEQLLDKETGEFDRGLFGWSNELVAHVVEIKNQIPVDEMASLAKGFSDEIAEINSRLEEHECLLLPTSMHPFFNPNKGVVLWPYGQRDIYQTYDRIFDCRGHGWANLQSMHINLSFATDQEFARLHSAIRAVLPLVPGLTASSPFVEGQLTPFKCNRLEVYKHNQVAVPSIIGQMIPEYSDSESHYISEVLQPMYRQIAPLDPEGLLQFEWLNSRAAIPKFNYGLIEIRICDLQENPQVDVAIACFFEALIRNLATEQMSSFLEITRLKTSDLREALESGIVHAEDAIISQKGLLEVFGFSESRLSVTEVLLGLTEQLFAKSQLSLTQFKLLQKIINLGSLSSRLIQRHQKEKNLVQIYKEISLNLQNGTIFEN